MLLRMKASRKKDQRVDRVQQEMLRAVKVTEEEIGAIASSPDLYGGLRVRIAAGRASLPGPRMANDDLRASERGRDLGSSLWARPSLRWTVAAAAVLILAALAVSLLLPSQSSLTAEITPALPQVVTPAPGGVQPEDKPRKERLDIAQSNKRDTAPVSVRRASNRQHLPEHTDAEVATDFFPLTYTAESAAPESGHVVRVKISRTALIAVGLPMNVARAGELITADVVIGDDGLARAIRFIQ
jgi:hypothetical protein